MKHLMKDLVFEDRGDYGRSVLFKEKDLDSPTRVQIMSLKPGGSIKAHYHEVRTECFVLLTDNGTISVDGETIGSIGDSILCKPGSVHEFINTDSINEMRFLVVRTNDPLGVNDMFYVGDSNE